jgi:hypothetical protein
MKKLACLLLFLCLFTLVTCNFENNADYEAIESRHSRVIIPPLDEETFSVFDPTPLREAYFRGGALLPFLKPTGNKFKLEKLLYGELDKDGKVTVEGVKQYLETNIPLNLSKSQQMAWQKSYDAKAQEVYDLIFTISMEQELR